MVCADHFELNSHELTTILLNSFFFLVFFEHMNVMRLKGKNFIFHFLGGFISKQQYKKKFLNVYIEFRMLKKRLIL